MAEAAPPPTHAPPLQVPLAAPGPFTPLEQLPQLQFCINSNPSWYEASILAFQHYIVMLGTTVLIATILVPKMGGSNGDKAQVIQTLLLTSGINTYLQTILGTRLPTVMNASFAFMIPVASIVRDSSARSLGSGSDHERFLHTMREIQGALIISSLVNILIGFTGAWKVITRLFSPVVISPLVCVAGLGLFRRGFPQVATCVEIGLPMLIAMVIGQQYLKCASHRLHFRFERFAMLFCIAIIWAFAAILTASGAYNNVRRETKRHCRTDMSYLLSSAPWIKFPYPFQWGMPTFSADHVFGMMGAAIVSCIESTGTHFAAARLAGATPPPTHVLSRSFGLQGIGLLLEGMFGTLVGTAASAENAGLLGLTRIGSRRVTQISTIFMIFFSIFGKFGAFFASIPLPIFAAIYCILFGLVAATGVTFIQFINQNSMRNIYILGLALFLGISIPEYFNEYDAQAGYGPAKTNSGWFNDIINAVFSSAPTVVILVGTLLDSTLETANAAYDRGLPWWHPFQRMKGDLRSEEFYSYPIRVRGIVPSRFTLKR